MYRYDSYVKGLVKTNSRVTVVCNYGNLNIIKIAFQIMML